MRVLKYDISAIGAPGMDLDPPNDIVMPIGAKVIAVGTQQGSMKLWAEVEEGTEENVQDRRFWVIGTGWPIDTTGRQLVHIGTSISNTGAFVWHVYEEKTIGG